MREKEGEESAVMPRFITIRDGKATNVQQEWDSDAHDDPGREKQLDESFAAWSAENIDALTENIQGLTMSIEAMTQEPGDNVFEAAEQLEEK